MERTQDLKPKWRKRLLVCAALAVIAVLALAPSALTAPKAESQAIAESTATQLVAVIVGKADSSGKAEALVATLGGRVTRDLHIINAFGADVPADRVPDLEADPSVAWVSLDAPVQSSGFWSSYYSGPPPNDYLDTLGVSRLSSYNDGGGIGVAVIDSGVEQDHDFMYWNRSRLAVQLSFNSASSDPGDVYGHGTHVAGIIAGDGSDSNGFYRGIAPGAKLYSLKITDDQGNATESDVVAAMQWIYDNKDKYNIRVVNLSVNSGSEASYHLSPVDAAAEVLWFNSVVVVASAGNKGPAGGYNTVSCAPANDPFIITVGATDEKGDGYRWNDVLAPFSAQGRTGDGYSKPELLAPGTSIYSVLSRASNWGQLYPERTSYYGQYFRLSGTSMAAPMVTGTVALILQNEPWLTPDQVKHRLLSTSSTLSNSRYLNTYSAVAYRTSGSSNTGLPISRLLTSSGDPVFSSSVMWNSVMWNSVMWNSVMWNSVMWNSVMWNSVNFDSAFWDKDRPPAWGHRR